jgi:hypothetical protein
MESALSTPDHRGGDVDVLGIAALVHLSYAGGDMVPIWNDLRARLSASPLDAAALLDLSVMLQVAGHREKGLEVQHSALQIERCFRQTHGRGNGLRVLVFMTAGDLMANTPIDFLLDGSDATQLLLFVDADTPDLRDIPEHDVAFIAIGESETNRPVLKNLQRLLSGWTGPILNNPPERILGLTRDGVAALFANEPSLLAPSTIRVKRDVLRKLAEGAMEIAVLLPNVAFPIIVRPIGTHAGQGMEKIDSREGLAAYLEKWPEQQFYLAPFIDYRGSDGLFRKQRIALIDGQPFASHLATSEHWMVHYLSAGMTENETRRLEEAAWMRDFDVDFAVRHGAAFDTLTRRVGLDYFVIDCAEMPDGRLLLFEVDIAMIVHAMDSEETFPYKKPAMRKLFNAFQGALQRRCNGRD